MTPVRWNTKLAVVAAAVCCLAAVASPARVDAQESGEAPLPAAEAVETGREALRRSASFPWYDAGEDDLERIRVRSINDADHRGSDWLSGKQKAPSNWSVNFWTGVLEVMNIVFWVVLGVILLGLAVLLIRYFLRNEIQFAGSDATVSAASESDAARIERLPFQVKRPQSDLLAEARAHYERGDYAEAIVYLFSYQLVELDKNHLIRLAKGKTNRQYLREIKRFRDLVPLLHRTMVSFEDVFFGNHDLQRQEFEASWSQLDQFHRLLQEMAQ